MGLFDDDDKLERIIVKANEAVKYDKELLRLAEIKVKDLKKQIKSSEQIIKDTQRLIVMRDKNRRK